MTPTDIRDICLKAASIMREGGLARGIRERDGAHCLLGALDASTIATPFAYNDELLLRAVAAKLSTPGPDDKDPYNFGTPSKSLQGILAWWSNTQAINAEHVALMLESVARTRPVAWLTLREQFDKLQPGEAFVQVGEGCDNLVRIKLQGKRYVTLPGGSVYDVESSPSIFTEPDRPTRNLARVTLTRDRREVPLA